MNELNLNLTEIEIQFIHSDDYELQFQSDHVIVITN